MELRFPLRSHDPRRHATLQPNAALAAPATYTARIIGGTTGARVMDLAGSALATTVAVTFTTATPPDTTITSGPANPTTSTAATFAFTATPVAGATSSARSTAPRMPPAPAR